MRRQARRSEDLKTLMGVVAVAVAGVLAFGCGGDPALDDDVMTGSIAGKSDDFGGCLVQHWPDEVPRLDVERLVEDRDYRPPEGVVTYANVSSGWPWSKKCSGETLAAWEMDLSEDLPLYATLFSAKAPLVLQVYALSHDGKWVLTPKGRLDRIKGTAEKANAQTREAGTLKVLLPPGRYRLAVGWNLGSAWWRSGGTYCTAECDGPDVAKNLFGKPAIWPADLVLRRGKHCPQLDLPPAFVIKEQRTWYQDQRGDGEHFSGWYGLPRFNVWGEDGRDYGEMYYDVDESKQWTLFKEINERTIRWDDTAGRSLLKTFEIETEKKIDVRNCDGMLIGMLSLVTDDGSGNTYYKITNSLGQIIGRSFRESPDPKIPINPAYWEPTRFVVKAPDSEEVIAETTGGRKAYADLWRVNLLRRGLDARLFLSSAVSQTTNDSQDQKACYTGNGNTNHYRVSLYGDLPPPDDEKCRYCCAKEGSELHSFDVSTTINDYCCGGYDDNNFCRMSCDVSRDVYYKCKCK